MTSLQVWVVLLTVLHTAAAYDVVNPFSWKAVEDAERHATAAVASLYADSVRMQQRVKEHVFAPEVADFTPAQECPPSLDPVVCQTAAGSGRALLLALIAIAAALLVGWSCGIKQAQSQQAMQQARAADQQAEACLNQRSETAAANLPQCEPQKLPHSAEARTLRSNDDESEHRSVNILDQSHQASAEVEEDCASSWGSVTDPDEQLTSEQQLHEQPQHQHRQHRQDYAPAPGHVAADIADRQASKPSLSPNEHLQQMHQPSRQTHPNEHTAAVQSRHVAVSASTPAKGPRQILGSSSHDIQLKDLQQQDDGLALVDDASYLIDVLVQRQGLNPSQLDVSVKLGLIVQAVGLLVTHRHQQEDHRLKNVANDQGAEHNTILREGQSDTKSWRQAKEEQKQLQQFFNRLADCLMCGLLLMLGGMLYWGVSLGYFEGRLSECKGRRAGFLANIWSPWQTVESLQTMWCYAAATLDLTGSVLLMLAVPFCVKKHGLLTNSMAQPMTGLVLGLGVACGLVGQFTVSRVGGDNMAWLSLYWMWIALHVLSIWMVHSLYRFLSSVSSGGSFEQVIANIKMPVYYCFMGILMPLAVAACPYWRLLVLS
ncbi:TPA: hypothetical protein ACH3X1_003340 [Trebouxia sp. C0004]